MRLNDDDNKKNTKPKLMLAPNDDDNKKKIKTEIRENACA